MAVTNHVSSGSRSRSPTFWRPLHDFCERRRNTTFAAGRITGELIVSRVAMSDWSIDSSPDNRPDGWFFALSPIDDHINEGISPVRVETSRKR